MERDFLKGLGIADDAIEKIMAQYGKDITAAKKAEADAQKQSISAKDTEIEGLKGQIAQRDADIKTLRDGASDAETFKKQLSELQGKYKTDTDALNKKLTDQATEFARKTATEKFFSGVKFSSSLARDAAMSQFRDKGLKLENDTFIGGKEWLEELKKSSPDAFAADDNPDPKPNFGGSVKNNQGHQPNSNIFGFNFVPQRSAGLPNSGNK